MFGSRAGRPLDKTVLITGASRGIGLATALAFRAAGARVAICARDPGRLAQAAEQLGDAEAVLAQAADVRVPEQMAKLVDAATGRFGHIDVLVNNAGILRVGPFSHSSFQDIDTVIDVNLKGVLYATRLVLPLMLVRGVGVIINVASGAGLTGFPDVASYCASKFGVVGFSESLAQEVGSRGVRVHAVCPGRVATDMQVQYSGARDGVAPERVAERILQLARPHPRAPLGTCVIVSE